MLSAISVEKEQNEAPPNKKRKLEIDETQIKDPIKNPDSLLVSTPSHLSTEKKYMNTDWFEALYEEMNKPYFIKIKDFLEQQKQSGKTIYPPEREIYSFTQCPLDQVKVVILGQDPYHGPDQAHGLCFSVKKGIKPPPSLKNIYKELCSNYDTFKAPTHGFLEPWVKQGVLMLNATLTVEKGKPNSHAQCGWMKYTDRIIELVNTKCTSVVFILWGAFAQKKGVSIHSKKHLVLRSAHPSPFSARNGFFGCNHFLKANEYLVENGKPAIKWDCLK